MEYINEFHKQWIERTRRSIEEWKKHPPTREEVLEQQKRLDQQRANCNTAIYNRLVSGYGDAILLLLTV